MPTTHSLLLSLLVSICAASSFYDNPEQDPLPPSGTPIEELREKWDFEWAFSGISTFAHLPHVKCLSTPYEPFDIGIIGVPFDTAVTYRPGARFGPRALRTASARQTTYRGFNHRAGFNPYKSWARILDCGDMPITPFDNQLAVKQMTEGYNELLSRRPLSYSPSKPTTAQHPRLISLGGDHSLALPALRALVAAYKQPIALLHFDAHLDTWHPRKYPSVWIANDIPVGEAPSDFTHGSMFYLASLEGLILNGSSVHAGLRTRLSGIDFADYDDDERQGFLRIESDDIDDLRPDGIVRKIMDRMGTEVPVYLSVDIDVLDPGLAPGTGTPEPGGWTSRELIRILRGVEGLNIVGADIVEVSPAWEGGSGEQTALAGAQVVFEILTSIVKKGLNGMATEGLKKGNLLRDEL